MFSPLVLLPILAFIVAGIILTFILMKRGTGDTTPDHDEPPTHRNAGSGG